MTEIKPIETNYNGYRFRSRLEARWAVFFDKAGIPYQYETEGFDLGDAGYYLPDFYLPWFKCYVEIKPKDYGKIEEAKDKLVRLFEGKGDCVVMLCQGDPVDNDINVYCFETDDGGGSFMWYDAKFVEGAWWRSTDSDWELGCAKHWISLVAKTSRETEFYSGNLSKAHIESECLDGFIFEPRHELEDARIDARSAQFEHGKSGN